MTIAPRTMTHGEVASVEVPADPRDEIMLYLSSMRAFAVSLTRNMTQADDLVQDTIVKAWTNIEKFQPGTNMQAWLFTILRNTFYSDRRKHRREVPDPDGLHAAGLAEKPAHDGRLAFNDFRHAFDKLSPEHREVLILVGANGFSDRAGLGDDWRGGGHGEKPHQPRPQEVGRTDGHGRGRNRDVVLDQRRDRCARGTQAA